MRTSLSNWLSTCVSAILFSVLTTVALAQTDNSVRLESTDNSVSLSGELIEAANGQYRVQTLAGELTIDINDVTCSGTACPQVEPNFTAGAEVTLASTDGKQTITGNIVDIVDDQYVVDNDIAGVIRVDTSFVECSGPGCPIGLRFADESDEVATVDQAPEAEPVVESENESGSNTATATNNLNAANASISFAGSDTVGRGLLPFLLDGYAETLNATAVKEDISETETFVRFVGTDNNEISSAYVNATGSGDATDALETKAVVFGMTSRQIRENEASRLINAGAIELRNTDFETVIAVDSLAVVTHPSNPLTEISIDSLGAIYLGEIDNWSQVGGPDAPITVLSRDDGSSTRGVFEGVIFDGEEPTLGQNVIYPGGDNPEMAAAVKADPNAIGYVGFAYSEGLNRLSLTSNCGITSAATPFTVKTEEYPLGRRLYLYNRDDHTPIEAEQFLQYVLSADADDAIAQSNFVNFAVERSPHSPSRSDIMYDNLDLQSALELRLARQMNIDLTLWDRLSTTVRFRNGSIRLDKKELNDINRLINALDEMPDDTRVAVVGFADNIGPFEENLQLSQLRAQNVAERIRLIAGNRLSNIQFETKSYSELSPSVCNDDAIGRAINRRVEIWVRK